MFLFFLKSGAMARLKTKPLPKPCASDLENSQNAKSRPPESPHHCRAVEYKMAKMDVAKSCNIHPWKSGCGCIWHIPSSVRDIITGDNALDGNIIKERTKSIWRLCEVFVSFIYQWQGHSPSLLCTMWCWLIYETCVNVCTNKQKTSKTTHQRTECTQCWEI